MMSDFHHFWLEAQARGIAEPFGAYCNEHEPRRPTASPSAHPRGSN